MQGDLGVPSVPDPPPPPPVFRASVWRLTPMLSRGNKGPNGDTKETFLPIPTAGDFEVAEKTLYLV